MAYRRIAYAALLGGAVLFQIVFRFYLSTFTLALVLLLPLLSVLLSLPSVLGCTLLLTSAAPTVVQGEDAVFQVRLRSRTRLPLPRLQARLHWSNQLIGAGGRVRWEPVRTAPGAPPTLELATPHCGRLICRAERAWTCDLLGLFPLPIPTGRPAAVLILPPDMEQALPERLLGGGPGGGALLPRPGGGPGEDYDLRDYRPGDPLRSVHWKLSSKRDELVVRETLEPRQTTLVLTYDHFGAPAALDQTFARLCAMKRKRRAAAPLRRGPAVLLGDGCLLLLVLAGTVFSFLTAFSVQIHALPLLLGCAAAALAFLGLWSLPRRWWALPLALLAAAWLLAVRRLWQPLALGADALRVDVVNTVSASLELGFTLEPALSLPEALWTNCATLLVLLALVPLGALLGLGVVRLRSFWLVFVSSFPFVLLPLCISVTPGWLPLMALVLGWVVPALTSLLARTSPLGAARLNLAALPAAALLLAALSLAMPMDTYQRPAWADRALQHLTNQAVRLGDGLLEGSGPFGIGSGGGRLADADGSVSLSDAGPLRFSGRTVLEVETDLTGRIYLRGLSDAVYDGESWQPLDEAAYNWQARLRGVTYGAPVTLDMDLGVTGTESLFAQFQPMNFPALAVRDAHPESPYARITVRNVGADPGYVYVPYHILTQPAELSGAEFVHDAYLARAARVWTHTIYVQPDASPAASAGLRGELSLAEAAYADFVREYYLQVPLYSENPALRQALDGALEPLADWLRQAQYVSPAAVKQPYELEAAQVVADYLAAVAEYDPDTPAAPEGEDFVAWFLTESHRGYCMHFASAAVLLLRSMGVPARYVSGFVADVPASGRVNVPDSAAHAWVEVYIDGYGWEPVEVTPVYAGSTPGQSGAEEPEATPSPTPTPQASRAPDSAAPTPTPTPSAALPNEGPKLPLRLLPALLAALLLVLALPLRRFWARRRRERRFQDENPNRAAIAAYLYLQRLTRWGAEPPARAGELAQKAKFSPHTLTAEERDAVLRAARAAAEAVDKSLPWWKRFAFRYLLGLY